MNALKWMASSPKPIFLVSMVSATNRGDSERIQTEQRLFDDEVFDLIRRGVAFEPKTILKHLPEYAVPESTAKNNLVAIEASLARIKKQGHVRSVGEFWSVVR